ncbi:MAG: 3-oxoacyl-ACP synthase [Phycisphaeraceae bacterium]|nr:3-oxoacyl-ACP synthase [Phycisphaeraceae bacterium]
MSPGSNSASGLRIAGTGFSVPQRVVDNAELAQSIDTSDEWITQRTGIRQRRIAGGDVGVRELGSAALRMALDNCGDAPPALDLVICATLTPEMCCPSTAARIAAEVGAAPAGAMDISAACSGFVYGINLAACLIDSGPYRHVGVVGVEMLSQIVDWNDRRTCVLFGDGAGAAVISRSDDPEQACLHQSMASDGGKWEMLYCPRSEDDLPPSLNGFTGQYNTLQMNGREVYKFAVTTLERTIDEALESCGLKPADLAMVIPHQSNLRILESARDRLGLPDDRFYINIDRYGNTSAASVPICLHELADAGRVGKGDLVLFVGIGGGLTWASSLWRL